MGQNAYLNSSGVAIADIRWNNANTDNGKWFIHVESGGTIMGSFAGSYYIGTYCEDSTACDYGEMGSCNYPQTYYNCNDEWIGPDIIKAFEGKVSLEGDTYTLNEDFTITDDTNFPITIEDGKVLMVKYTITYKVLIMGRFI